MLLKNVSITNFKSIKAVNFEAKRVNVFIGEPNSGKSNLLEAIGIFTVPLLLPISSTQKKFKFSGYNQDIIRLTEDIDIVFDKEINNKVSVIIDKFQYTFTAIIASHQFFIANENKTKQNLTSNTPFKFYRFVKRMFQENQPTEEPLPFLKPVNGRNLEYIFSHHKDVRKAVKNILEPFFKIVFKQGTDELSFQKQIFGDDDDVDRVVEFSLTQISDTLLRMIFYYAAITSNKDSVIVFEEPETKSFPFHVKMLAENIALDENKNQFFIATHNPYMVLSLLEKTPPDEINIIITHMNKKGETQIHVMKPDEICETLDEPYEIFFNFSRFIDKD